MSGSLCPALRGVTLKLGSSESCFVFFSCHSPVGVALPQRGPATLAPAPSPASAALHRALCRTPHGLRVSMRGDATELRRDAPSVIGPSGDTQANRRGGVGMVPEVILKSLLRGLRPSRPRRGRRERGASHCFCGVKDCLRPETRSATRRSVCFSYYHHHKDRLRTETAKLAACS